MRRRILRASLFGVVLTAAFVPASLAGTQTRKASVGVFAGVLTYRDAPGAADTVLLTSTASPGGSFDVVVATANHVRAGAGCTRAGAFRVRCSGVSSAAIFLGGGSDTLGVDSGALPRVVRGGSGNDRLFGGTGHDVLKGGAGDDDVDAGFGVGDGAVVRGGPGQDFLGGSGGPDTLIGGDGPDGLIGRAGPDTLLGGAGMIISWVSTQGTSEEHRPALTRTRSQAVPAEIGSSAARRATVSSAERETTSSSAKAAATSIRRTPEGTGSGRRQEPCGLFESCPLRSRNGRRCCE
jgi:hypothetical protein